MARDYVDDIYNSLIIYIRKVLGDILSTHRAMEAPKLDPSPAHARYPKLAHNRALGGSFGWIDFTP
jgi:hypothetical protein